MERLEYESLHCGSCDGFHRKKRLLGSSEQLPYDRDAKIWLLDDGPRGDLRLRCFHFLEKCSRGWMMRYSGQLPRSDLIRCIQRTTLTETDGHRRYLEFRPPPAAPRAEAPQEEAEVPAPAPPPSLPKKPKKIPAPKRARDASAPPPPAPKKPKKTAASRRKPAPVPAFLATPTTFAAAAKKQKTAKDRLEGSIKSLDRTTVEARKAGAATHGQETASGLGINRASAE